MFLVLGGSCGFFKDMTKYGLFFARLSQLSFKIRQASGKDPENVSDVVHHHIYCVTVTVLPLHEVVVFHHSVAQIGDDGEQDRAP